MGKVLVVAVFGALLVGLGTRADAAGQDGARSMGDAFVHRLIADGSACTVVAKKGYFGHRANYLASCTSKDESFRFLVVVRAKSGSLQIDTPYIRDRIDDICKDTGGVVFTAGVKDRFAAIYLGRGDDVTDGTGAFSAVRLWNGLTEQLASTSGAFHTGETCANGKVTRKVA